MVNRGPETAELQVLPHLWFRNTWWQSPDEPRPWLEQGASPAGRRERSSAQHPDLGTRYLVCDRAGELLFTENETNEARLCRTPELHAVRQGRDQRLHRGRRPRGGRIPPAEGTKAAAHYALSVGPGETQVVRLLLTGRDAVVDGGPVRRASTRRSTARSREADEFYAALTPDVRGRRRRGGHAAGVRRHALEPAGFLLRPRPGGWRSGA